MKIPTPSAVIEKLVAQSTETIEKSVTFTKKLKETFAADHLFWYSADKELVCLLCQKRQYTLDCPADPETVLSLFPAMLKFFLGRHPDGLNGAYQYATITGDLDVLQTEPYELSEYIKMLTINGLLSAKKCTHRFNFYKAGFMHCDFSDVIETLTAEAQENCQDARGCCPFCKTFIAGSEFDIVPFPEQHRPECIVKNHLLKHSEKKLGKSPQENVDMSKETISRWVQRISQFLTDVCSPTFWDKQ
ncbi:hypothetical protein ACO0QE_000364 [Hanseniaspora vineae]